MKLAAGTRLGPYEIEHTIGAGGMGVVYRADDPRLGRKVAIKVLPQAGGEHFRRFEREARTIGSLNHPNLLTLHDVGEHDGVPFLVTELLEGESLRARLARGKLPVRQAVRIAAEVARGLAAAHDAGVIHRDIKPDNVFLTADGRTKILDFGIAKLRRSTVEMSAVDPHVDTPVPTTRDTGVVVGTPGYMAPEQLDAGEVDERSDIFALGVVLYEMICGKRAFASASAVEESYAILKVTPEPPKGATKALARVVLRCLEKRKDDRFQSAGDLAFALGELDASTDPVARISKVAFDTDPQGAKTVRDPPRPELPAPPRPGRARWVALAALALIAAGLGGVLVGRRTASPPADLVRPQWPSLVPGGAAYRRVTFHTQPTWDARLAPDGKAVLYSTPRDGRLEIVRATLGQPGSATTNLTGTLLDVSARGELAVLGDDAAAPGGGTLSRVFEGAGLRPVADHVTAAAFLPDDALAIVRGGLVVEAPVGTPIVRHARGKLDHLRAAPGGDRLAFAQHASAGDSGGEIVVVDRAGAPLVTSRTLAGVEGIAWSPDGEEVWYSSEETIYALDRAGRERVVLRGPTRLVLVDARAGQILVAPSDLRLKMFAGPLAEARRELSWFDSSDVESITSDGGAVAFVEAAGGNLTPEGAPCFVRRGDRPATLIGHAFRCALLPDGDAVIAVSGPHQLQRIPTGVGAPTAIPLGAIAELDIGDRLAVAWGGRYLVVRGAPAGGALGLWRFDLTQLPAGPQRVPGAEAPGPHPITRDGETIAVARAAGGVQLISMSGGSMSGAAPRELAGPPGEVPITFSGDDRALFTLRVVDATIEITRIELATGAREPWGRITPEQAPSYYAVALSADGRQVAYSTNADASDLYVIERPASP